MSEMMTDELSLVQQRIAAAEAEASRILRNYANMSHEDVKRFEAGQLSERELLKMRRAGK